MPACRIPAGLRPPGSARTCARVSCVADRPDQIARAPSQRALRRVALLALGASRFCRTHRGDPTFINLNHIASGIGTTRESSKAPWPPRDDRVGLGAILNRVPLFDLLVEEHVESVPAAPKRIDLAHDASIASQGLAPGSSRRGLSRGWLLTFRAPHGANNSSSQEKIGSSVPTSSYWPKWSKP